MAARILLTGVWHETNTFSSLPTDIGAFHAYQFAEGEELLEQNTGTNTEIGGMIEAAAGCDFELRPALFAGAVPGGTVTAEAFDEITERTLDRVGAMDGIDGALVVLHGAMVAEGADEADAVYLERLREALPAGCPVVAHLGMGVLAYADVDATAEAMADALAAFIWARRRAFRSDLVSAEAAVSRALAAPEGPIVLADTADNVGGGSAADGTVLLAELLRQGATSAAVVLNDPAALAVADGIGIGGDFDGPVGGKNDDKHGDPVRLRGRVRFLDDVSYARRGDYMTGQKVRLGRVAVVDAGGIEVMLTTERAMPFDADHLRVVGIRPEEKKILVVKSPIAWRAHFRRFAKGEIYVDTPGVAANDLGRFAYTKLARPLYPLDPDATWP
ncbi:MAG: MlrC C-terminal domain-containing protein [Alphaproteobacteria bacterium]|jgi:microcystin degradation protein MlrC|nr:MlrC C-terminal domain-containing protein [Alphaproteobacteria bacterium]